MGERYNVVSLFSGCGGLDLGFERLKGTLNEPVNDNVFDIVWACDINENATKTYEENFEAKRYEDVDKMYNNSDLNEKIVYQGDVRKVDFSKILNKEDIDLMLGGFPCQDFSMLRGKEKRKGVKVKRGKLYLEYVRALVELQPQMFVAENVKGLKSANDGLAFEQIIDDFQNLNENWEDIKKDLETDPQVPSNFENYKILFSNVVNFSEYGVPQNRERLVIIGIRQDLLKKSRNNNLIMELINNIPDILLPPKEDYYPVTPIELFEGKLLNELENDYKNIMKEYKNGQDYKYSIKDFDSERAEKYWKEVWSTYSLNIYEDYCKVNDLDGNKLDNKWDEIYKNHKEVLREIGALENSLYAEDFVDLDGTHKKARSHKKTKRRLEHIPPGENHVFVKGTEYSVKGLMSNIYRRLHPLVPSTTVIANGGGGTWGYHYERAKYQLTNRERARIQTFPDRFKFSGNKSDVRKQIGNAVPPLGAKKIAKVIYSILDKISSTKADKLKSKLEPNYSVEQREQEVSSVVREKAI
ncbi:hypothetical protein JCM16358_10940 [Halanaerocella petrolearia]